MIRLISRICVIGITLGVAAFVVVLSIMNGFNGSIKTRYLSVEPHLVVYESPKAESSLELETLEKQLLKNDIEFKSIAPFEVQDVFLKGPEGFSGAVSKGLTRKDLRSLFVRVEKGKVKPEVAATTYANDVNLSIGGVDLPELSEVVDQLKPGEILMGIELARSMGIYEGDTLDVMPPETLILPAGEIPDKEQVTVKALFNVDVAEVDSRYLFYVKGETLTGIMHPASLRKGAEIRLKQPELYSGAFDLLQKSYDSVESWVDRNSALFLALKVEKITMTTFMSLSGLITCFTIITILILLITQKRADVGIMMTLGLSPHRAQSLFQWIGGYLFGVGLLGGLVLGVGISLFLEYVPLEVLPEIYYDRTLPSKLDGGMVLFLVIGASLVAIVTSWVPARKMSQLTPVNALRKK